MRYQLKTHAAAGLVAGHGDGTYVRTCNVWGYTVSPHPARARHGHLNKNKEDQDETKTKQNKGIVARSCITGQLHCT